MGLGRMGSSLAFARVRVVESRLVPQENYVSNTRNPRGAGRVWVAGLP